MAVFFGRAGETEVKLGTIDADDGIVTSRGEAGRKEAVGLDEGPKLVVGLDNPHGPEAMTIKKDSDPGRLHPVAAHALQHRLGCIP